LLEDLLHESETTNHGSRFFDMIVSNPPYVARHEIGLLEREVREHEPETALLGGETGIEMYQRLIGQATRLLSPGGILVVELGYGAADPVRRMLQVAPGWANIGTTDDLAGIPRVLAAQHV
jgi:release factor glutamine methyltransferase